jgi:hypothetical protein
MPDRVSCPTTARLQELLLGQLPEEELSVLEGHLEGCSHCSGLLSTLETDDPLVASARAEAGRQPQDPESELVETLVQRLQRLPSPSGVTGDEPTTAGGGASDSLAEGSELLAPPQAPDEIGRLGPYRILRVLGGGGMGIVFEAEDLRLRRRVALKVIRPALAGSASARQRFLREARATASIGHDNIVTLLQAGEDRGVLFLTMPLLEGETLDARLRREPLLPLADVLRIGREVAAGLAAAHERGIIHRDVKPANVWLEAGSGRVKILDFGVARAVESEAGATHTGTIVGSPAYMAPEQAAGEPIDPRSDLFSLGCLLYRMCAGRPPFAGKNATATLLAVTQGKPTSPRKYNRAVPRALADLVLRLLAKRPADRPPSAQATAEALEAIAQGKRGLPPRHRWRWVVLIAVALAVLAGLAAVILALANRGRTDGGDPPREPAAAPSPCFFAPQVRYAVGRQPYAVAVGDFNGDGKPDLAVSNIADNTISILMGQGGGTFGPAVAVPTGRGPHGIVAADVNGDGRIDLIVSELGNDSVGVLLGRGDGTFEAPRHFPAGLGPRGLAVADLNGDGILDVVTTATRGNAVAVLLGLGDGTFAPAAEFRAGGGPISVAVADLDGDGKPDLVVSNSEGNTLSVLLGNGDGTFRPARHYAVGSGPGAVVVADFNGDGKPDLAVENFGGNDVSVLLGHGDGTFARAVSYPAGRGPGGLAVGDFNSDGVADLAVANHHSFDLSVLQGNGDGTFKPALSCGAGWMSAGVAVADLNGDGRPDLVVANHRSHDVSVLLNRPAAPHFRLSGRIEDLAGGGFSVAITAVDRAGNVETDYQGTVHLSSTDPRAELAGDATFGPDDNGVVTLHVKFRTAGVQTLTVSDTAAPSRLGTTSVLIYPTAPVRFQVTAPEGRVSTAVPVTVTALDVHGNRVGIYDGAVRLTDADGRQFGPAAYRFRQDDEGAHTFSLTFPSAGVQTVTATDTAARALTGSVRVTVVAGP